MAARIFGALVLLAFGPSPAHGITLMPQAISLEDIVRTMNASASLMPAQLSGCSALAAAVPTTSKAAQDFAAAAGVIDVAIAAMRRFPDEKAIQVTCSNAVANSILFNRPNGLRAGHLGGLNLTLAAYRKWMDDPIVTSLGGNIGAYLDYCDENRAILRELGGVHLLIQNIKNNFHGQYNDWGYTPVLNSLYGLSSGCWRSEEQCYQEGFVELAVRLMDEHTSDQKIAEETLQAVKALLYHSPNDYRIAFAEAGLAEKLVKVLRENPTDRGAVSLACAATAIFVGPDMMADVAGHRRPMPFSPEIQALATKAGAVEQLLATVTSDAELVHFVHPFNFDVDASYDANADCVHALVAMAFQNPTNRETMKTAGLVENLVSKLRRSELKGNAKIGACTVVAQLMSTSVTSLETSKETSGTGCTQWWNELAVLLAPLAIGRT